MGGGGGRGEGRGERDGEGKGGGVRRNHNGGKLRDRCFSSHGALTLFALCLVVQSGVIVEDGETKSAECGCAQSASHTHTHTHTQGQTLTR